MTDHVIPGEVYAWIAVVVLPINSALNPFLYTFSAIFGKKVALFSTPLAGILKNINGINFGRKTLPELKDWYYFYIEKHSE